jgi:hypothetical protein
MKASDVWIYLLIGGLVVWWIFGRQITNVVDLGANAKIGGKTVDTRYKGPLEQAPYEAPSGTVVPDDTEPPLPPWFLNPWLGL